MFLAAEAAADAAVVDPNQDEDEDDKDDDAWLVWLLLAETAVANRPKGSAPSHGQDDMVIVAWCFVYETRALRTAPRRPRAHTERVDE